MILQQKVLRMVDKGQALWQGNKPGQIKPFRKKVVKAKDLSEMVNEDRR